MHIMELIPSLPEEVSFECLTRLHHSALRDASRVSRRWRDLLASPDFHHKRSQTGHTQKTACLLQSIPSSAHSQNLKFPSSLCYGLTLFDPASRTWERLSPVPKYPHGLPLFCRLASSEGKLIVMGGWDPVTYDPVGDVFVYDFTTQKWSQGKDMPSKRSLFAIGAIDGRVYIAGGHDENKCALKSAWSYDVRKDEWAELTQMSQERDECEALVIGDDEFWVVSGYGNEKQGMFAASAESYQLSTGEWRRVEGAWKLGLSPRSCAGLGKMGS
ncbi:unnamed protein product [Thlaspi arvense]|uniref:F-box domain-containing protein n=1 Tax=Thlaspi arvense TaxID=13288 RepID=A0AAU9RKI2_THLAR|nr:unnamed protein product [Thlaspi arvense]